MSRILCVIASPRFIMVFLIQVAFSSVTSVIIPPCFSAIFTTFKPEALEKYPLNASLSFLNRVLSSIFMLSGRLTRQLISVRLTRIYISEVLEGSSSEDEVEDETFGRIFPRSRTRRGEEFFPFPRPFRGRDEEFLGISAFFSAILRTRLLILVFRGRGRDEARNFAPFLGHFEVETRPSRTSDLGIGRTKLEPRV